MIACISEFRPGVIIGKDASSAPTLLSQPTCPPLAQSHTMAMSLTFEEEFGALFAYRESRT